MVRFLLFGDLHYDHIQDGDRRLKELAAHVKRESVDFVMCLGDLCAPVEENLRVRRLLEDTGVPVHYALGNHDLERYGRRTALQFFGLARGYYAFRNRDVKFLVLDTHDGDAPFLPPEQLHWLSEELEEDCRFVIFSHHSLVNEFGRRGVANREEVRRRLKGHRVLCCLNGHDHGDDCRVVDGIPYVTVNSASYVWVEGIWLYREALHALVEIDERQMRIGGMRGSYQSGGPDQGSWNGVRIGPRISDRIWNG